MDVSFDIGTGAKKYLKVQNKVCRTCPHRNQSVVDPKKIHEYCGNTIIQKCHHTHTEDLSVDHGIICRAFYNRHKDNETIKLAESLNQLRFVDVDIYDKGQIVTLIEMRFSKEKEDAPIKETSSKMQLVNADTYTTTT